MLSTLCTHLELLALLLGADIVGLQILQYLLQLIQNLPFTQFAFIHLNRSTSLDHRATQLTLLRTAAYFSD